MANASTKTPVTEYLACPFCDGDALPLRICDHARKPVGGAFHWVFCPSCKSRCFISPVGLSEARNRKKISALE